MLDNIHEPIKENSNIGEETYQYLKKKFWQVVIGGGILIALSLASILLQDDYVKGLFYTVPLIIIVPWLAISLYPKKSFRNIPKHYFELNENGIYEELINAETDEIDDHETIPFSSMNRIIIGNFVRKRKRQQGFSKEYYEFNAIMVIEHDGRQYTKIFNNMEEFENWLPRFLDKGCEVVKTEYDLAPAFYESDQVGMNLSGITVEPWQNDTSYPPIGEESRDNPYVPWGVQPLALD